MHPAITAWTGAAVNQVEPDPGNDGIWFMGYKVTNPTPGVYHYEYAVYNQNLDRSIQSFSVPLSAGVNLSNIEFHAPPQEPGFANDGTFNNQGYSSMPWTVTQTSDSITWNSETFAQNQNANAIRWGTMYNFRFDADQPPQSCQCDSRVLQDRVANDGRNPGACRRRNAYADTNRHGHCNCHSHADRNRHGYGHGDCNPEAHPITKEQSYAQASSNSATASLALFRHSEQKVTTFVRNLFLLVSQAIEKIDHLISARPTLTEGSTTMSKICLTGFALLSVLFFANASGNNASQPKQNASETLTGTLQKMIVENASVTMQLDLNGLNGSSSLVARPVTLQFAAAPNSFFPILVFNDLLRGLQPGSMALALQNSSSAGVNAPGYSNLPAALRSSLKRLTVEKLPSGQGFDLAVRDSNTGFTFFNIEGHRVQLRCCGSVA